ncbi:MAG: thioredoxin family protein [Chitinophagaceae bacterium]|nr:thioredoxin family protein [Chitinophagaceae bacterium]
MIRKAAAILFVLFFSLKLTAQHTPVTAAVILQEAGTLAANEKKNVFVIFTASWCIWCKKMDKSMNDPLCKNYFNDNYIIRHLVVDESPDKKHLENAGADSLRKVYHGDGQGIPFWLIFDKDGKLLADSNMPGVMAGEAMNTGCPASEKEVNYFIKRLAETSRFTPEQLALIYKRFRQNDN